MQLCGDFLSISSALSVSTCDARFVASWSCSACQAAWINCQTSLCSLLPPSNTSTQCVGPAPNPTFYCSPLGWASNHSVASTNFNTSANSTIIIQGGLTAVNLTLANGTTIVIEGNLIVNSTIVVGGSTSSVTVLGCANVTSVQVTLNDTDIEQLQKSGGQKFDLIHQQGSHCNDPASSISINIIQSTPCKTASADSSGSNSATLSFLLTVQNSCSPDRKNGSANAWWIILVSTVGGVVLLISLFILFALVHPASRHLLRSCLPGRSPKSPEDYASAPAE